MLSAALDIAASVGAVLPISPQTRKPLVAFALATREESGVRSLWERHPDAAPGVLASSSRLLVIDVEHPSKGGDDGFRTFDVMQHEIGELPATRRHRTKSGGAHLIYRVPSDARLRSAQGVIRRREQPAPGIDIVTGHAVLRWPPTPGYVPANDAPIADLPQAWVDALGEAPRRPVEIEGDSTSSRPYALGALRGEANALAEVAVRRNCALARSAFRLGRFIPTITIAEIEDVLLEACRINGSHREHGERVCVATIRRCAKAGA